MKPIVNLGKFEYTQMKKPIFLKTAW